MMENQHHLETETGGAVDEMFPVLYNGWDIGDLVEEVKLALVEIFSWTRERTDDLLNQLLQKIPDISYKTEQEQAVNGRLHSEQQLLIIKQSF